MHPASQLVLTAAKKARNASYDDGLRLDGKLFENGDYSLMFIKPESPEITM